MGRLICLRERCLRADAVLLDKGNKHIPLAAVADRRLHQIADRLIVKRCFQLRQGCFQEEVCLFQLVIESHIILGQLELSFDLVFLYDHFTQHIQRCEQPASA